MSDEEKEAAASKEATYEQCLGWINSVDRDIERLVKQRLMYLRIYHGLGGRSLALLDEPYWLRVAKQFTGARADRNLSYRQYCESRTLSKRFPNRSVLRQYSLSLVTNLPPAIRRFLRVVRGDTLFWTEEADDTVSVRVIERVPDPSIEDKLRKWYP